MKEVQCMEDKSRANVYDDGRKTTGVNLKNALTHAEVARLEQVDYSVIANLCSAQNRSLLDCSPQYRFNTLSAARFCLPPPSLSANNILSITICHILSQQKDASCAE